jgi:hypothetical protein
VLGIAAIIIGISVFSSYLEFKKDTAKQEVTSLFNISYFILMFILVIPVVKKTGDDLQHVTRTRNFLVYCSILTILSSVIIYLFEK